MVKVAKLYIKRAKGSPPENAVKLALKENAGVCGDIFATGGDRQVSLLYQKTQDEIDALSHGEPCLKKFCCNILLEGEKPSDLRVGQTITIGEAALEISSVGKECHSLCGLDVCPLVGGAVFARVSRAGVIKIGDIISYD
ncbi:MAG: hypothetical protein GX107_02365 [Clostridiales bacterium]|jgi:MOSC domain-containing protein YiiM|nr:hypothetical protein [Clostridiales bacterium]